MKLTYFKVLYFYYLLIRKLANEHCHKQLLHKIVYKGEGGQNCPEFGPLGLYTSLDPQWVIYFPKMTATRSRIIRDQNAVLRDANTHWGKFI